MGKRLMPEEKAEREAARAAERERVKALKLEEKVAARRAKVEAAEQGRTPLPAMVTRDGMVTPVYLNIAADLLRSCFGALCLDVETTGYQLGHVNYGLRTIQLGNEHAAVVLDADDPVQRGLASWALKSARKLHAFSAAADLVPVVAAGLIDWDEAWSKMYDGVLYAKLSDPKMSGSDAEGLKELSKDLLGGYAVAPSADSARSVLFKTMKCLTKTKVNTPVERSGWAQVNKNSVTMIQYAGSDVLDLGAVIRTLEPQLPVSEAVLDRERECEAVCSRVALDGYDLDLPHIQEKIAEYELRQYNAQTIVFALSGGEITNPSSSPEVIKYLTEAGYTLKPDRKTKQPSAGKASLEPYANRGDVLCKYILEYRHCTTTLGLLLRPLENLCTHGDGKMRPTVYTIEAQTGRMSCVRPNGQQFSRQGGIRACVIF
jgi:hypothetical protein